MSITNHLGREQLSAPTMSSINSVGTTWFYETSILMPRYFGCFVHRLCFVTAGAWTTGLLHTPMLCISWWNAETSIIYHFNYSRWHMRWGLELGSMKFCYTQNLHYCCLKASAAHISMAKLGNCLSPFDVVALGSLFPFLSCLRHQSFPRDQSWPRQSVITFVISDHHHHHPWPTLLSLPCIIFSGNSCSSLKRQQEILPFLWKATMSSLLHTVAWDDTLPESLYRQFALTASAHVWYVVNGWTGMELQCITWIMLHKGIRKVDMATHYKGHSIKWSFPFVHLF